MQYGSQEDYKAKMDNRWRKANNYEVFAFNFCMECRYFKADMDAGSAYHGNCSLMEMEGVYSGIMPTAVCDRYINRRGFDLNGKVVDPAALARLDTDTDGQKDRRNVYCRITHTPGRMAPAITTHAGGVTPAKENTTMTGIKHTYTQADFGTMALKVGALKDFAELLEYNYDHKVDGPVLDSIALIIKTLLDPVDDFLVWAILNAEIPTGEDK